MAGERARDVEVPRNAIGVVRLEVDGDARLGNALISRSDDEASLHKNLFGELLSRL